MLRLTTYVAKTVLSATLIVCLSLMAIFFIITFLAQTATIGTGNYTALQAFLYVLLQIPSNLYLIMPMSALLGCLMGLGVLANNSELIVMRSIGYSIFQVGKGVILAGAILSIISLIIGGYIAPKSTSLAEFNKAFATDGKQAVLSNQSQQLWLKEGNNFIQLHKNRHTGHITDITKYTITNGNLSNISHAKQALYINSKWKMLNINNLKINKSNITKTTNKTQEWDSLLPPNLIQVISSNPQYLTIFSLIQYVYYSNNKTQNTQSIKLTIWNLLLQPLMIIILMLMAVPFCFGPMRSTAMGLKLVIGLGLGFIFYILDQFFTTITLVYNLPPFIGAITPCLIFLMILIFLFIKMRE